MAELKTQAAADHLQSAIDTLASPVSPEIDALDSRAEEQRFRLFFALMRVRLVLQR